MKFANATDLNRKSGGAEWRDLLFLFRGAPPAPSELDGNLNRTWCEEGELGTKPCGHSYQVRERLSFHLPHHLASVCLDRDLADVQFCTDLFIQKPRHHQSHDLPLTVAKRRIAMTERPHSCLAVKDNRATFESFPDGT